MGLEQILAAVRNFDGVLELAPREGSEYPEIAWGDHFFYFSADGAIPQNRQPYATIITKDYPDDAASNLNPPDRWRLNIHVGVTRFTELIGEGPRSFTPRDSSEADAIMPHPVYAALGWVAIVNPGPRTTAAALSLLHEAHLTDRRRVERRSGAHPEE